MVVHVQEHEHVAYWVDDCTAYDPSDPPPATIWEGYPAALGMDPGSGNVNGHGLRARSTRQRLGQTHAIGQQPDLAEARL